MIRGFWTHGKVIVLFIAGLGLDSFRKFDPSVSKTFYQVLKTTVLCCPNLYCSKMKENQPIDVVRKKNFRHFYCSTKQIFNISFVVYLFLIYQIFCPLILSIFTTVVRWEYLKDIVLFRVRRIHISKSHR